MVMITKLTEKEIVGVGRELKDAIGAEKVKDDEITLVTYGFDSSVTPFRKPSFVVLPQSREDVQEILRIANKYKIPVAAMAGGVNVTGLTLAAQGGILLDFRRMDKIEINTDSGYAVIEPGITFDKFIAALAEKGFRCHVPTSPGGSAPLGNYTMRPSGSLSNRHLDSILDLEVVLPDGTVVNTGSSHFPSAGSSLRYGPFPDLAGLYCNAYGTLGVITKAAVRIYPKNESTRINITAFDSFESAVKFVKDVINHNIPESCIIWNYHLYKAFDLDLGKELADIPELGYEPSQPPKGYPYTIVTTFMSGYEESMVSNDKVCKKVAKKYGGRALSWEEVEEIAAGAVKGWDQLYLQHRTTNPGRFFATGRYLAWIVMTEPKDTVDLEKWAVETVSGLGVRPVCYYSMPFDFGRCMFFRIFIFPDSQNRELLDKVVETYKAMYQEAMKRYGAIPFRFRPGPQGSTWIQQTGGYYDLLKRIKKVIDPNDILSPHTELF
jgi:FAD/FMN-containing dehydrogenase